MATATKQKDGYRASYDSATGVATPITAPVTTPVSPTAITADSLKPVTPFKVTPATPATQSVGLQGEIQTNVDTFANDLAEQKKTAETNLKASKDPLQAYIASLQSTSALTDTAYKQKGGVDDTQKELNDINSQINAEIQSERRRQEALDKNPQGLFGGALEQEKARINRESIAKQADLSVIQLARQGRYDSAKSIADRAVTAKFEQQKLNLDALKFNYQENKDLFTKAEQRQFETMQNDRERKLNQEEANLKQISDLSIQALQDGAPTSIASAMRSAKTVDEAIKIGGQYVGALDRQLKQSQLYTSSLQQSKLLQELNPTETADNGALASYGDQFAETGKLPSPSELKDSGLSVTQVTEYAKQSPKQGGVILSANTGVKPSNLSSAQADGIAALYDIKQKTAQLKALDLERQKGLGSAVIGKLLGSSDQQKYIDLRQEIVDLLSRARTGAALTAAEEKFYAGQLPGRVGQFGVLPGGNKGLLGVQTQERIGNFESKIDGTLQTKLNASGAVIQGYSKVSVPSLGTKTVGEVVDIGGTQYRVLPDGSLTDII